ncbi:MAG: helix-turn-helix transcriptional regulator [Clostridia bacterium]|nr:helix-turn-helix transcriptional regulator [Clostridia bacterium]
MLYHVWSLISSACGFPDYNYFIRLFKKRIGVTPLQFRKKEQDSTYPKE